MLSKLPACLIHVSQWTYTDAGTNCYKWLVDAWNSDIWYRYMQYMSVVIYASCTTDIEN